MVTGTAYVDYGIPTHNNFVVSYQIPYVSMAVVILIYFICKSLIFGIEVGGNEARQIHWYC